MTMLSLTTAIAACLLVSPTVCFRPDKAGVSAPLMEPTDRKSSIVDLAPGHLAASQEPQLLQVLQREEAVQLQPSGSTTTTSHESFFQRMGNAFMGVIVGIIMLIFSVPVLWLNEKRSAKYEALIHAGEQECRDITADNYDEDNTNWLVHVTGDSAAKKAVKDEQFNVSYDSGVIRLSSVVEIYQYQEEEKSKTTEKETLGGGKTTQTETWYEYKLGWHALYNSGQSFKKPGYGNAKPAGIEAGSYSQTCERVEFGRGFLMRDAELQQLSGDTPADINNKVICENNSKLQFEKGVDLKLYCCKNGIASPEVGDVRVSFTVLNDGPTTVVGLQAALKGEERAGFLPYRVIRRPPCPCCPLSEEQEKQRLYDEAVRDPDEIVNEDMWHGAMMCVCCVSNIVTYCCLRGFMPELHHAFTSSMSKAQAFATIKSNASALKWLFRVVGWLLMYVGLALIFGPFTTFLKLIPLGIGGFLSSVAGAIVWVFSFMVTLVAAVLIVTMAYLMYRPMIGILALTALAAIVTGIVVLCNALKVPQ